MNNKGSWIWYPGDFEIYHGQQQNCSREERGYNWPAFWKMDDCRKNVRFYKACNVTNPVSFTVLSRKQGYVDIDGKKHPYGKKLALEAGEHRIVVHTACTEGLPAIYVESNTIPSDESWLVDDYIHSPVIVGTSPYYMDKNQNPEIWQYEERICYPVSVQEDSEGILYDFGEEITAVVVCHFHNGFHRLKICYGESEKEARDVSMCYYSQTLEKEDDTIARRAFRYLFITEEKKENLDVYAIHQYVDIPSIGSFSCDDERINQIWKTAETTFKLCSGVFFIDGIKRDKWIWSGDAYQSYFINQYLMFDEEINKRTILALRGNEPVEQHINTIVDYSMYWIISIYNHYIAFGDDKFVKMIYPKMRTLMEYLAGRTDENGFIIGRDADWTFIDWADIDKEGAVCAEQMLLARCWEVMSLCAGLAGDDGEDYAQQYRKLIRQINHYFWNEESGAYIDSFSSGLNHVTRHGNIFALLFHIANEYQEKPILNNVIFSDKIAAITTPYFKFYELEVLCRLGELASVKEKIEAYWGAMLDRGAVTFWEEFDPKQPEEEQYSMYDDPYGKSFCHAWAGSPIYLIGRYFMGVRPLKPGYEEFEVKPACDMWKEAECTVPLKDGKVIIRWKEGKLSVRTDRDGGCLIWKNQKIQLEKNRTTVVLL